MRKSSPFVIESLQPSYQAFAGCLLKAYYSQRYMSVAELDLRRTLTDLLDDELSRLPGNNNELYNLKQANSNKSLEDFLSLPEQSLSWNVNCYQQFWPLQSSTLRGSNSLNNHCSSGGNIEGLDDSVQEMNIFNKYADPNLTTTDGIESTRSVENNVEKNKLSITNTPLKQTISLNSIIPVNPFVSMSSSKNNSCESSQMRITTMNQDLDENLLGDDDYARDMYQDEHHDKFHYLSLQENQQCINQHDILTMFDQEFHDEDDLSDEDDLNAFDDLDDDSQIFDHTRRISSHSILNNESFVDNDMIICYEGEEHDDSSSIFDENDILFESNKSVRKPSVVISMEKLEKKLVSTPPSSDIQGSVLALRNKKNTNSQMNNAVNSRKSFVTNINLTPHTLKKNNTSGIQIGLNSVNAGEEHTCHLINSVTKEPCLKKFSRPYDLIRHQKTIHASKKKIFRCLICIQEHGTEGYQRTFSRNDALSRHVKVKHELTGDEAQKAIQFAKDNVEYIGA